MIGKFCSIACGAKFLFNSANHSLSSLSTYPFPIFYEEWGLDRKNVAEAWDNKGDSAQASPKSFPLKNVSELALPEPRRQSYTAAIPDFL